MTNGKFKQIRTNVHEFEKIVNFNDRIIGVILNGVKYSRSKDEGKLSDKQLKYFEYLNDFEIEQRINI